MTDQVSGFKRFLGKAQTSKVKFMGENVEIKKLTVTEVEDIQEASKAIAEDPSKGFDVLKKVLKLGCLETADLDDADFKQFPLDDLNKLSGEIMKLSGIASDSGK